MDSMNSYTPHQETAVADQRHVVNIAPFCRFHCLKIIMEIHP